MTNRLADSWTDVLLESHREALHAALCLLCDDYLDRPADREAIVVSHLPGQNVLKYDERFLRGFFATLVTVGYKLAQPTPPSPFLSCTAEELALNALITEAEAIIMGQGVDPDFSEFEDSLYQDMDFRLLFDPAMDGIEDSEVGDTLGVGRLRFSEWFAPFENATAAVNPYSSDTGMDQDKGDSGQE